MKVLKTKKVNVVIYYNGLRNMPPKEFPSIGEMEKAADMMEDFEEVVPDFVKLLKEGEQVNTDIQTGTLEGEQVMPARLDIQKRSNLLEKEQGEDIVEIEFENDAFNTFFQMFERWGKLWFNKLGAFLEARKDMNATNAQAKDKKPAKPAEKEEEKKPEEKKEEKAS